jgi:putative lipoic acid-binding regulatory protein
MLSKRSAEMSTKKGKAKPRFWDKVYVVCPECGVDDWYARIFWRRSARCHKCAARISFEDAQKMCITCSYKHPFLTIERCRTCMKDGVCENWFPDILRLDVGEIVSLRKILEADRDG